MKKISTAGNLERLRQYAESGRWSEATNLYFDACLEDRDVASLDELHEAVWARDSRAVAAIVGRLAAASRLMANPGRVKPIAPGFERAKAPKGETEQRA